MTDSVKMFFRNVSIITRRETLSFLLSPAAYIVFTLFMVISGIMFFYNYFIGGEASLRGYFEVLPWLLSVFIPAVTMRLFSEEWSTGSIEMLLTSPFTEWEITSGKYFSALILSLLMLMPSMLYLVTVIITGSPDPGTLTGGYIGAFFLCCVYSAAGIFISAMSSSQVISLIGSIALCFSLYFVYFALQFIPGKAAEVLQYISTGYHFKNFAKGVIDSRELVYFISVSFVFLYSAKNAVNRRR